MGNTAQTIALIKAFGGGSGGGGGGGSSDSVIFATVDMQTGTLNMTVQELLDAIKNSIVFTVLDLWESDESIEQYVLSGIWIERNVYNVDFACGSNHVAFYADNITDYPAIHYGQ